MRFLGCLILGTSELQSTSVVLRFGDLVLISWVVA